MDTLTILWIVIIVGAMVNSYVSKTRKARKARQEGGNPPPQHGEAWPSIPWDEEDNTKPSVPTANTRPETPAQTAPAAETAQSVNGGRRRQNREKNTPLSSIHPTVQETCNPGNNWQKDEKSGDQHPVSETFTDECQSLEEIFPEEYFSDLDTASDLDTEEEPQTASFTPLTGLGSQLTVRNERRGAKQGKQSQNSAPVSDSLAEMVEEFDLRRAVIYSEILKPKFDEEFNPANQR
ncbi:hypothetical protein B5E60_02135 [Alistipes sp. An116]|uniref:hypothetical protein n=1 Tax=Alistipes sp. An116 TaxID=1965546 RepID=UPI000B36BDE8|nr:hypothetical protein [Alistipes sp. An116]OUQ54590.1 hypothetical protein B5E60_02135 [Alistipes sp. An116]